MGRKFLLQEPLWFNSRVRLKTRTFLLLLSPMVREGIVLLKDLVIEGRLMSFEDVAIIYDIFRKDYTKFNSYKQ